MTLRLIHQSWPRAVAVLGSARPQGNLNLDRTTELLEYLPSHYEAQQLLNQMKKEAISRIFLNHCSSVSAKVDNETVVEGMGSFSSTARVPKADDLDEDVEFITTTREELLARCEEEQELEDLEELPPPFERKFIKPIPQHTSDENQDKNKDTDTKTIRIFQWNLLSQTLGTKNDQFVKCPPSALDWTTRRWRIIEELIRFDPDIICLQEVDHYKLIKKALRSIGYHGRFVPKPDSPCLYLEDNNGPDGCAIFYKKQTFELISKSSRSVEIWGAKSNQVVLSLNLRHNESEKDICVATTHLKARNGALLSSLRNEQGKDILNWLETFRESRPIILTGDFNAEPLEPVYKTVTENKKTPLQSSYTMNKDEKEGVEDCLEYTTWKIRETGEEKHILDYIFHSPQLQTVSTLEMPTEQQIGENRLPSLQFASDHLSLVADMQI